MKVSGVGCQVSGIKGANKSLKGLFRILSSFFFDQTGRPPEAGKLFRPVAALKPDT
jgi:hypothetical protein